MLEVFGTLHCISTWPCDHSSACCHSDVSESEAADTVPPLRLLYSGRRRTLNFNRIE